MTGDRADREKAREGILPRPKKDEVGLDSLELLWPPPPADVEKAPSNRQGDETSSDNLHRWVCSIDRVSTAITGP